MAGGRLHTTEDEEYVCRWCSYPSETAYTDMFDKKKKRNTATGIVWWNTKDTIGGENFSEGEKERGRGSVLEDTILKRTGSPKEFRSMEKGPGGVVWQILFFTALKFPSEFLIPFLYSITSTFSTFNVAESLGETLLRFLFVVACTRNITSCPIDLLTVSFS